ncbi:amino acid ABC transporter permease [Agrobacterium tumefaciens]|uniref:amino acid ABC transporter permease n=1 Tax=Agrobacterium tumefaciens TaxID=358 RepID=UPI0015745F08|nr:amino acid ABC transporter permease [Agrobacterium tumefaciens]MCZ7497349.1 amino acid ABC transporter permease [Rhizobium rhizogenes]NTE56563.1 amino acid ABC transporter permease [Agrobacterium tumefaciens]NTE74531.1 amino acid ABC transporter permease [Agrobacterium tumefaciens]
MSALFEHIDTFFSGFVTTLALAVVSAAIALPAGIVLAALRVFPAQGPRTLAIVYVEILRNTPITVVFFFSAFVLPQLGVRLPYFAFAIVALVAYYAAFFCEAVRSGINAVPAGQAEAARAIGLPSVRVLSEIIVPQALRAAIPPIINVVIALIKSTAVASAFGVAESLSTMEQLANRESTAIIAILCATAVLYLSITIPLGLVAGRVERTLRFIR